MRDIKFRGKSLHYDKWVYGFYLEQDTYNAGSKNTKKDLIAKNQELIVECSKYSSVTPVQRDTIGQYTGLRDKNGAEIYEGDIVKLFGDKEYIGMIKYDLASFIIDTGKIIGYLGDVDIQEQLVEVIGNIYDNPELLEVKQMEKEEYKLCYIDDNKAWFTDNFDEQWRRRLGRQAV